jgi:hypothetical protein
MALDVLYFYFVVGRGGGGVRSKNIFFCFLNGG